jgi:hypothetical protein
MNLCLWNERFQQVFAGKNRISQDCLLLKKNGGMLLPGEKTSLFLMPLPIRQSLQKRESKKL